MKSWISVVVLGSFAVTACSPGAGTAIAAADTPPAGYVGRINPLGPEAAYGGAEIFKVNCSSCHGAAGGGDGPASAALSPKPRNLVEFQRSAADDYLFWRINVGRAGTSMAAWKGILEEGQIWAIIAYLRTLK